ATEYGVPTRPVGSGDAAATIGVTIVSGIAFVALPWGLSLSLTCALMVYGPAVVGLPLMTPVTGLIVRPSGKPVAEKVRGETPFTALQLMVYETPVKTGGAEAGVHVSVMEGA